MKVSLVDLETFDPHGLAPDQSHFIVTLPQAQAANPNKSLHDLDQSLNRLQILSDLIRQGFDFSQSSGQALVPQLEETIIRLRGDTQLYRELLEQLVTRSAPK